MFRMKNGSSNQIFIFIIHIIRSKLAFIGLFNKSSCLYFLFCCCLGNLNVKGKRKVRCEDIEKIIITNGGKVSSLYIYHFSTVIDFSSEKYSGSTGLCNPGVASSRLTIGGKVITDFTVKFRSEIVGTVVTVQREIEKEAKKITKAIQTAFRRKWDFVNPEYILQFGDGIAQPLEDNKELYKLNLQHMETSPENTLAKVSISNVTHHLLDNRKVSAHRIIKKALREKPMKPKNNENRSSTQGPKKSHVSGYPAFVKKNFLKLKAETGIKELSVLSRMLSEKWKLLSPKEKKLYSITEQNIVEE